ncbi:pyruvate formate-lyase-activating protein [Streptomyces sp. L7]
MYCANPDTWHMRDGQRRRASTRSWGRSGSSAISSPRPAAGSPITGGEPLLQPAFTAEILRRCKEAGLHTALDTSGFLGARATATNSSPTPTWCSSTSSPSTSHTYRKLTGGELAPHAQLRHPPRPARRPDVDQVRPWSPAGPTTRRPWTRWRVSWRNSARSSGSTVLPFHKLGASEVRRLSAFPSRLQDNPVPGPGPDRERPHTLQEAWSPAPFDRLSETSEPACRTRHRHPRPSVCGARENA